MPDPPICLIHTIPHAFSHHGGPSRSVPALCDALSDLVQVAMVTASPDTLLNTVRLPIRARSVVVREPELVGQLRGAPAFADTLRDLASQMRAEVLHDHGVWLPGNHASAMVAGQLSIKRVVSPRGMLSGWALKHRRYKKALAWQLYQKADLSTASAFHATSEKEAQEIRALGFRQPIAVVPNGVKIPDIGRTTRQRGAPRTALFMSRLHKKKGVRDLILAWAQVRPAGWRLCVVGPDEGGYRATLEREAASLGLGDQVAFAGEVSDEDKWSLYADADLFVLPSYDENFGIVVAEALAAGLPVITTTATPWQDVARNNMGWIAQPGVEELAQVLREACKLDADALASMGRQARSWAVTALGWSSIAQRMLLFYEWLLGRRADTPSWVQV